MKPIWRSLAHNLKAILQQTLKEWIRRITGHECMHGIHYIPLKISFFNCKYIIIFTARWHNTIFCSSTQLLLPRLIPSQTGFQTSNATSYGYKWLSAGLTKYGIPAVGTYNHCIIIEAISLTITWQGCLESSSDSVYYVSVLPGCYNNMPLLSSSVHLWHFLPHKIYSEWCPNMKLILGLLILEKSL